MKSNYQMTEEHQNVFEWHCRSSETITKVKVSWGTSDKVYKIKGYDKDAPFGMYFWEHWPKHLQKDLDETDDKHHNGAFQQRYMREIK